MGIALSLSFSLLVGLGIPFLAYGLMQSREIWNFGLLLVVGAFLTFIFVALAFAISLRNENKIKGFGYGILLWLFLAAIYDGLFLILLVTFHEYPLDKFTLAASFLNPIDLSRILTLLKLDISALLGYTGALFQKYFGSGLGMVMSLGSLVVWTILPMWMIVNRSGKKDF